MANCTGDHIRWMEVLFAECVHTPRQQASVYLGLVSTLCGVYSTLPQVILNFKLRSAEGLSLGFIALLFAGDVANLVGVIVTHGLGTQIACAVWYICLDVLTLLQYAYYVWAVPRACPGRAPLAPLLLASAAAAAGARDPYRPPALAGTLLGWLSTTAYAASRLPQIVHNCRRRSTEGLSIQVFIVTILANVTYGASIFAWDERWPYVWQQMPWLAGSLGMLGFDVVMIGQFLAFGSGGKAEDAAMYTEAGESAALSAASQVMD